MDLHKLVRLLVAVVLIVFIGTGMFPFVRMMVYDVEPSNRYWWVFASLFSPVIWWFRVQLKNDENVHVIEIKTTKDEQETSEFYSDVLKKASSAVFVSNRMGWLHKDSALHKTMLDRLASGSLSLEIILSKTLNDEVADSLITQGAVLREHVEGASLIRFALFNSGRPNAEFCAVPNRGYPKNMIVLLKGEEASSMLKLAKEKIGGLQKVGVPRKSLSFQRKPKSKRPRPVKAV